MSIKISQEEIHQLSHAQAQSLCWALRDEILQAVSKQGGHLASNLGVVETIVAIHRVFHLERDRLVFDVGHQCYAHKLLTGRDLSSMRTFGHVSGFPKPNESDYDAFIAGHASTAVSTALGMARARTCLQEDYHVLALLGDGALTGGLAYEGLSDAGQSGEPLIVILNDNGMSITKNVGGVATYLSHQRLKPQYIHFREQYRKLLSQTAAGRAVHSFNHRVKQAIKKGLLPCSMFEDMGFTYLGPVDGHDVKGLTELLTYAKGIPGPVLLHVRTVKGRGYRPAEETPDAFHGIGPFQLSNGVPYSPSGDTFSSVFGQELCDISQENRRVAAITAAMQDGTGLQEFAQRFPNRFFDVGIAEGHAVTMSAGMAKQGMTPVFAVYSSFLQRAYDMLLHDVAIQQLHIVLAVDRAGLVGEDGETHHGLFDIAYLRTVPGMTVLCPSSYAELRGMLRRAVNHMTGPVAIRYPRGSEGPLYAGDSGIDSGMTVLRSGNDITLVGYGTLVNNLLEAADLLHGHGIEAQVLKLNQVAPIDWSIFDQSITSQRILVAEETVQQGCVGIEIAAHLAERPEKPAEIVLCNCGENFVPQGSIQQLQKLCGIDAQSLAERAMEVCKYGA